MDHLCRLLNQELDFMEHNEVQVIFEEFFSLLITKMAQSPGILADSPVIALIHDMLLGCSSEYAYEILLKNPGWIKHIVHIVETETEFGKLNWHTNIAELLKTILLFLKESPKGKELLKDIREGVNLDSIEKQTLGIISDDSCEALEMCIEILRNFTADDDI